MGKKDVNSSSNSTSKLGVSSSSSLASFLTMEFSPMSQPKPKFISLAQKWAKLLFNPEFSDIQIIVGSDSSGSFEKQQHQEEKQGEEVIYPCHRLVLCATSPFFWKLFKSSEELTVIRFIEFSPESIRIFLKYLYTEELDPGIFKNHEILLHILELSTKFEVPSLRHHCVTNFLKLELSHQNALTIWMRAREYKEMELEEFSIKYICMNAEKILTGIPQSFLELQHHDLKALIKRDDLQVEEYLLFTAVLEWAKYRCSSRGFSTSGPNLRRMLRDAIYLIRFPLLTTSLFTNVIIPKGILTADEISKVLRLMYLPSQYESDVDSRLNLISKYDHNNNNNNCNSSDHPYSFNSISRLKKGPLFTVSRFGAVGSDEKFFGDKFYSVRFVANRSIALVGFGFFGPAPWTIKNLKNPTDKLIFDIEVHLRRFDGSLFTFAIASKSIVITREKWEKYKDCHKKLSVNFDFPVSIQQNSWYHLQYRINGPPTLSGLPASRKSKVSVSCRNHGDVHFQFLGFPDNLDESQLPDLIFKFF